MGGHDGKRYSKKCVLTKEMAAFEDFLETSRYCQGISKYLVNRLKILLVQLRHSKFFFDSP